MRRDERGAVTAEAALGMSLLVLVSLGLAWMVSLGVVAIRAQDAAREAARALARGESEPTASDLARQVAGATAEVTAALEGRLVRITVRLSVRGPGGVFAFIGSPTVTGQAVSLMETTDAASPR